jgi:hypothetical protein
MLRSFRIGLSLIACVAPLAGVLTFGQQAPAVGAAPVPPVIFTAKRVFVSNAGADSRLFPHPFSGNADRAYDQFYGALQGWGRYELVAEPEEAELVFELQLMGPSGPANPNKKKGAADPLPMFRLAIIDGRTHFVLWAMTESIAAGESAEDSRSQLR